MGFRAVRRFWSGCASTATRIGGAGRGLVRGCLPMKKAPLPLTPEQRIKALEVQLRAAEEKARLFEAVIDVLKRDYGVKVVKKPSGKSSRSSSFKG